MSRIYPFCVPDELCKLLLLNSCTSDYIYADEYNVSSSWLLGFLEHAIEKAHKYVSFCICQVY